MGLCTLGVVSCSYSQYGRVAALIPEKGGVVDTTDFGENVNLFFHIPKESFDFLQAALIDATSGTCHAQAEDEAYYELG